MNKTELKIFLEQNKFYPVKQFGQNFLINQNTIQKIVHAVQKHNPPFVEIGPGYGALTTHFKDKKKDILLVERDKKIAAYWKNHSYSVLSADALKLNWRQKLPKKCSLFGNLPYQIVGSLILKSSINQKQIKSMVLMMQKEVAQRVLSKAKSQNYGLLSVIAQTFWSVSPLLHVPKTDFYPKPKVDGTVLEFHSKKETIHMEPESFLKFVKKCFSMKRKMLFKKIDFLSNVETKKILNNLNLPQTCRAEELSWEQFVKLYLYVYSKK